MPRRTDSLNEPAGAPSRPAMNRTGAQNPRTSSQFPSQNISPSLSLDWTIWKSKLQRGEKIPVFFHKTGSEVTSFGLSYLYKFLYVNSTKTMLDIRQRRAGKIDLSEAIFGYSIDIPRRRIDLEVSQDEHDVVILPITSYRTSYSFL